jgi:hypothetical protein
MDKEMRGKSEEKERRAKKENKGKGKKKNNKEGQFRHFTSRFSR